ncbi:1-acyl-sn-glycerol-3-phosphate acyltransferase [Candidatus Woesebacteria bacterium]|jgi:1-acyl-sn-glycerol-3-phosphate acyltransferase|nr:1-acyl-sn-glycerol-3-phosphate acyltransferase [Candidatus Woesebacteria bacterium]HOP38920.1 lysophospholipid acyltransferase family protein [Candidatus Woesebacteria bacterium]HPK08594.1 lysophospholipid acyltransferase family protein [Candidatus Woesebacteria bacterium]
MKKHYYLENFLYFVGRSIARLYTKIDLKKQIKSKKQFPLGAKIFAVNHPSTLDPLYIMSSIKEPVHALLTEDVFKIFGLNKLIAWAGHVAVGRNSGLIALNQAITLLTKNRSILIFPEGMVSKNSQQVEKLKTGAVRMALATGAPIIPIGICVDPQKIKKFTIKIKNQENQFYWYRRGAYLITYGAPIYFTGELNNQELVRNHSIILRNKIQQLLMRGYRLLELATTK